MAPLGRFAPSPTGALHAGNLRTALTSWLWAHRDPVRSGETTARWLVRMEDLDRVTSSVAHGTAQLADLAALGMVSELPVVNQSDRFSIYREALAALTERGLTYPCYCTRREIRDAASAPHGAPAGYPGTCRNLSTARRLGYERDGRSPAIRLRTDRGARQVPDLFLGTIVAEVDDVVLCRNDGVPAYHLAVVVDDAAQGVTEVVRADDLAASTSSQVELQRLLGLPTPTYAHIPLVVGPGGRRLAKRDGATTLADLAALGVTPAELMSMLLASLGLGSITFPGPVVTAAELTAVASGFDITRIPRAPWCWPPLDLERSRE